MRLLVPPLRQVVRALRRAPRFTALGVMTLAIGIGGNIALFSVVDRIFFRPLPFGDPERLVRIQDFSTTPDGRRMPVNVLDTHLLALASDARVFDGIAAEDDRSMTLSGAGRAARINVLSAAAGTWATLQVHPMAGRLFTPDEERVGADAGVVLISNGLWVNRFGGRAGAVGESIRLDDRVYRIVGVLPPGFRFPWEADAWIPERVVPSGRRDYAVYARLKPGVALFRAKADLSAVAEHIRRDDPSALRGYGLDLRPIREDLMEGRQRLAVALAALVIVFFSIACANVANLQLARVVARQRELVIRSALGASPAVRLQLVLTESALLAAAGTFCGLLIAFWLSDSFAVLVPAAFNRDLGFASDSLSGRLLVFSGLVCVVTTITAGALPSFASTRIAGSVLLASDRTLTSTNRRALDLFVGGQLALAAILLTALGLVLHDLVAQTRRPLGADARRVLATAVTLPRHGYADGTSKELVTQRILLRVGQIPGVDGASISAVNPFAGNRWRAQVEPEGNTTRRDSGFLVNHRLVSSGFFDSLRIPIVEGRSFTMRDTARSEPVAIVSVRLAAHFWPNQPAVGRRLRSLRGSEPWRRVVGVVGDVADQGDMDETWYVPYSQGVNGPFTDAFYVMAHARTDPAALVTTLEAAIQSIDPAMSVYGTAVLEDQVRESLLPAKFGTVVVVALSAFGLILALVGTYSVTAYVASAHRGESAIRIALGASSAEIVRQELRHTVGVAVAAAPIGIAGSLVMGESIRSVLGVAYRTDMSTIVATTVALTVTALLAAALPALRASQVDPAELLKGN